MTDAEILGALDDRRALGLTLYGESRGSPLEERVAVGWVVRNRLARPARWRATDASYKAICFAPRQFSCWNQGSGSNHDALMAEARRMVDGVVDPLLAECLYLADGVIAGVLLDRTEGANSYWAPRAMIPPGRIPAWAIGQAAILIGDQRFVKV